jgi:hypothetical protein
MLRIDRVSAEMDVTGASQGSAAPRPDGASMMSDPQLRERLKELVREALRDHLRELERRGVV